MNIQLKLALMRRFGSQIRATKPLGIDEPTLSRLVQGHRDPTPDQRKRLREALGRDYFKLRGRKVVFPTHFTKTTRRPLPERSRDV